MDKKSLLSLLFLFLIGFAYSQEPDTSNVIYLPAQVIDGDTIIVANLNPVTIGTPGKQFEHKWEEKQYWKLVYNIKKVLPYAKMARVKLDEMNAYFLTLDTERQRKQYAKKVEDEIRAQFEEQLKALTVTQGKLLIKLIYRETGNVSYDLVKEFRGGLSAMFWQTFARLFGLNLKTKYDPAGEDFLMEEIVVAVENGLI
jgi:hypothetical protein